MTVLFCILAVAGMSVSAHFAHKFLSKMFRS